MAPDSHFWSMPAPTDPAGVLLLILAVLAACGVAVIVWLLSPAGRRSLGRTLAAAGVLLAVWAAVVGLAVLTGWVIR